MAPSPERCWGGHRPRERPRSCQAESIYRRCRGTSSALLGQLSAVPPCTEPLNSPREQLGCPILKAVPKSTTEGQQRPRGLLAPPGGQQGEPHSRERAESRLHHRLLQDAPRAAQSLLGRAALPAPPSEVITKSLALPPCVRIRVCLEKEDDKSPCICRAEHRRCFYHRLPCREGHRALWEESHRAISGHSQLTEQF